MIFHNVEQNSDSWFELRRGKATSSNFGKIMANYEKAFGEPAKKYAYRIAYEQVTGDFFEEDSFSNNNMENGHIWEPVAREDYELEKFTEVSNGGFCESEKINNVGGSPDGLILGEKGGIEIKSVIPYTQFKNLKRGTFDPAYKWQLIGNMWLCDLEWIDFISYGFRNTEKNKLHIFRLIASEYKEEFKNLESRLHDFMELVDNQKKYV